MQLIFFPEEFAKHGNGKKREKRCSSQTHITLAPASTQGKLHFWQWKRLFGLSVVFFGFSFSRFSHPWWMSHFIELVTVERRMDNLSIKFKFHLDSVKRMEEMKEAKRTRLTTWGRLFRDKDRSCQQTWHLGQCERGPRSPFLYSSHLWTVFCCIL